MKKLVYLLACLILFVSPAQAAALSPSSDAVYDGIDVSHWQGDINFEHVAASGISIVYIKSSEGTGLIDPNFETNYENAKRSGLKVGFYHYLTASTAEDAAAEAQYFASLIQDKAYDCYPAMDYESFDLSLDTAGIQAVAQAFLKTLQEATGSNVLLYSDVSRSGDVFGSAFAAYPLWISDYTGTLPADAGGWSSWTGYQYSGTGSVPGISANVDLNKFTADVLLSSSNLESGSDTSSGSEAGTGSADGVSSSDASGSGTSVNDTTETSAVPPLSYMVSIAGFTALFTITVGGGGIGIGLHISRRRSSQETVPEEAEEALAEDLNHLQSRHQVMDEIRQIEELELLELQGLQEERKLRLQEQRAAREQQELDELRHLQRKAQELQEELWALKVKAMQDPTSQE